MSSCVQSTLEKPQEIPPEPLDCWKGNDVSEAKAQLQLAVQQPILSGKGENGNWKRRLEMCARWRRPSAEIRVKIGHRGNRQKQEKRFLSVLCSYISQISDIL